MRAVQDSFAFNKKEKLRKLFKAGEKRKCFVLVNSWDGGIVRKIRIEYKFFDTIPPAS